MAEPKYIGFDNLPDPRCLELNAWLNPSILGRAIFQTQINFGSTIYIGSDSFVITNFRARHKQNKIKRENIKQLIKHLEENKKFIGEKNIPECPGNYQKLVKEDQNIQD
jgi:hypothetical protein